MSDFYPDLERGPPTVPGQRHFNPRLRYHQARDFGISSKEFLKRTAVNVISNWAFNKMGGIRGTNLKADFDGAAPNAPPSKQRKISQTEKVTDAETGRSTTETHNRTTSINTSSLISGRSVYDSYLLPALGENQLTSLRVKLGPREYADQLKSFFSMVLGVNAKTRSSWAGRMRANVGARHYHHEVFRHNLSADDTDTQLAYPADILDRILFPVPNTVFSIDGTNTATDTSFRDFQLARHYYVPDNRSDLEGLSWNQCKLKLAGEGIGVSGNLVSVQPVEPLFLFNQHARKSKLAKANESDAEFTVANKAPQGRYKAVINYGKITYNFMNKGEGGAEVILVVFKVKKNRLMSSTYAEYADPHFTYPMGASISAIGAGWVNTCATQYSTEQHNGRRVLPEDINENPCFPFLPQLKKTRQGEVDVLEVTRQTFAMPSGSRREVVLDLPGLIYDPLSLPVPTGLSAPSGRGIVDNYSYIVTLACNGTRSTRIIETNPAAVPDSDLGHAVGDMHGACNIQYNASYMECVGPAIYVQPKTVMLANDGDIKDPRSEFHEYTKKTGLIVSQDRAFRATPVITKVYDSGGFHTGTSVQNGTGLAGGAMDELR